MTKPQTYDAQNNFDVNLAGSISKYSITVTNHNSYDSIIMSSGGVTWCTHVIIAHHNYMYMYDVDSVLHVYVLTYNCTYTIVHHC